MRTKAKLQELELRVEDIETERFVDMRRICRLFSNEIVKIYGVLEKMVPKDDLEKAIEEVGKGGSGGKRSEA